MVLAKPPRGRPSATRQCKAGCGEELGGLRTAQLLDHFTDWSHASGAKRQVPHLLVGGLVCSQRVAGGGSSLQKEAFRTWWHEARSRCATEVMIEAYRSRTLRFTCTVSHGAGHLASVAALRKTSLTIVPKHSDAMDPF